MMPISVDIIMLSYAKDPFLRKLTEQSIFTLLNSEDVDNVNFNILVIESQKDALPYVFRNTQTIYPDEPFGYNKYMNIGIKMTKNSYVCLCNNDLLFHKKWATEIIGSFKKDKKILSANPLCTRFHYNKTIKEGPEIMTNSKYKNVSGILTGWCIFVKRDIFKIIGLFDEQFIFWYADNDYAQTLRKYKIHHALVKSSYVDHLVSQSHQTFNENQLNQFTYGQEEKFKAKWIQNRSYIRKMLRYIKSNADKLKKLLQRNLN